jgi:hypothetical protein
MLSVRDEVFWESGFYIFDKFIAEEKEVDDFSEEIIF